MRPQSAVLQEAAPSGVSWAPTRPDPSPLISDHHQRFAIPTNDAACDALLASAEARLKHQPPGVRQELVADLARVLGAGSRVWTQKRRARLRRLLADAGPISVDPVLNVAAATPRDEVLDDAVGVLAAACDADDSVATSLVNFLRHVTFARSGAAGAPRREVALRALAASDNPIATEARLNVAHRLARTDPSPQVRDAAVQAISMMCRREGHEIIVDLLMKLKRAEASPQVRESIDDAIASVRTL
jgi:hypothetical protein